MTDVFMKLHKPSWATDLQKFANDEDDKNSSIIHPKKRYLGSNAHCNIMISFPRKVEQINYN